MGLFDTQITARLVDQLEIGADTRRMPWHTIPGVVDVRNPATGSHYRGANTLTLAVEVIDTDHPTGWWATYKQWADLDAQARKGGRSAGIVKLVAAKTKDDQPAATGDDENRRTLVPRVYSVFNTAQVDGWNPTRCHNPNRHREPRRRGVHRRHRRPHHLRAQPRACPPAQHRIKLPNPEQFADTETHYSTTCRGPTH